MAAVMPSMANPGMSARAWTLFAAVSVLWGIPYLFIKLAVEDLSPVMVAWGRIMSPSRSCCRTRSTRARCAGSRKRWKRDADLLVVEIVLPWPLIGFGEQRVSSGLAAILIAAVPLVVALMALRVDPDERAEGARLAGLVVGFAGVVVLLGLDVAGRPGELLGALAILLAAVGYAAGPMIIKHRSATSTRSARSPRRWASPRSCSRRPALATAPTLDAGGDAIASVVVLGLLCSALAFLFFFALINEVGPGRATVITYVNPVVAVALGVALLGERSARRRSPACC